MRHRETWVNSLEASIIVWWRSDGNREELKNLPRQPFSAYRTALSSLFSASRVLLALKLQPEAHVGGWGVGTSQGLMQTLRQFLEFALLWLKGLLSRLKATFMKALYTQSSMKLKRNAQREADGGKIHPQNDSSYSREESQLDFLRSFPACFVVDLRHKYWPLAFQISHDPSHTLLELTTLIFACPHKCNQREWENDHCLLCSSVVNLISAGSITDQVYSKDFLGTSVVKNLPGNAGDLGSVPGSGVAPGEGIGYPLQYSCLENPMDRGAWWAIIHGATRSQTHSWATNTFTFHSLRNASLHPSYLKGL